MRVSQNEGPLETPRDVWGVQRDHGRPYLEFYTDYFVKGHINLLSSLTQIRLI